MAYTKKFSEYYRRLGWEDFSLHFYDTLKDYIPRGEFKYLDVACGTGVLANRMAQIKRAKVDAFDISPAMISLAKKKSKRAHFFVADMIGFKIASRYDLITCLYDSVNCLEGLDKWERFFRNVYNALKNGGVFIFDYNNLKAKKNWRKSYRRNFDRFQVIQKGAEIQNGAKLNLQIFYKERKIIEETFVNYMYSNYEIRKILKRLDFTIVREWQNKFKNRNFVVCRKS